MNKFNNQNKINYVSLTILSFLFISLSLYLSYLIDEYNFYENLGISIIFIYIICLILSVPLLYIYGKILTLIFRFSGVELTNNHDKRSSSLTVIGHLLFLYMADEFLHLDDIKSAFIRIIVKSSLLTAYLIGIVKYYNNSLYNEEKE